MMAVSMAVPSRQPSIFFYMVTVYRYQVGKLQCNMKHGPANAYNVSSILLCTIACWMMSHNRRTEVKVDPPIAFILCSYCCNVRVIYISLRVLVSDMPALARSQRPGQARPKCWPEMAFGPAWVLGKPKPLAWAGALGAMKFARSEFYYVLYYAVEILKFPF